MTTQLLSGQRHVIGEKEVSWIPTTTGTYQVALLDRTDSSLLTWEFTSPINEAVSYCWYDYVVRTLQQEEQYGKTQIPPFLLTTSSLQAEDLINMVWERL